MRLGVTSLVALAFCVFGVMAAPGATAALGTPPRQCGDYEYLQNTTCLIQSRAMTFAIAPKTVAPGGIVTVTTTVLFDAPASSPGSAAVSWSWNSIAGSIGTRLPGCGPEKGSKPLVSRCRFKAGAATGRWRTVTLFFSTYVGPAQSRDYFAIVAKKTPVKQGQTPSKPPVKCVAPPGKSSITLKAWLDGDPRWVVVRRQGRVTTTEKGSNQPLNLLVNRHAGPGTVVKTGPNAVVSIGSIDGPSVLVGPNTTVRLTNRSITILDRPANPSITIKRSGRPYKVRTCSAVLSSRG